MTRAQENNPAWLWDDRNASFFLKCLGGIAVAVLGAAVLSLGILILTNGFPFTSADFICIGAAGVMAGVGKVIYETVFAAYGFFSNISSEKASVPDLTAFAPLLEG